MDPEELQDQETDQEDEAPNPEESDKPKGEEEESGETEDSSEPEGGESGKEDESNKQLKRRLFHASERIRKAEERLARYEAQQRENRPELPAAPKRDDFEDEEKYLEARDNHNRKVWEREREEQEQRTAAERTRAEKDQAITSNWESQKNAARQKYDDFDAALTTMEVPINGHIAEHVMSSDIGGEMAYHIANHPEALGDISTLSFAQLNAKLVALENTVRESLNKKPVSKAPAPTDTVKGTTIHADEPSDKDDDATWIQKRQKQVHGG